MRRSGGWLLAALGMPAALLLAGCGSSVATVTGTQDGTTYSVVVSSDSTGISLVKEEISSGGSDGNFQGASVSDGDQHTGNDVCSFSTSKNGHTYQLTWYVSHVPAGTTTSELASLLCSAQVKQSFDSQLPNS